MSTQAEYQANDYAATGSAGDAAANNTSQPSQATPTQTSAAPNIRHIPIFVEGRDQPLINRNHETTANQSSSSSGPRASSNQQQHQQHSAANNVNRSASGSSASQHPNAATFDWSKKYPTMGGHQSSAASNQQQRSDSPQRTVPMSHYGTSSGNGIGSKHGNFPGPTQQWQQQQQQPQHQPTPAAGYSQTDGGSARHQKPVSGEHDASSAEPAHNVSADYASLAKIEKIQRDVLELMHQVSIVEKNRSIQE